MALAEAVTAGSPDRAPDWVAAGTPPALRAALAEAVGAAEVHGDATALVAYASDASPYRKLPRAVVTPRDVPGVVALLAWARRTRTPLTFRAGGTSLNGQSQSDSVLVDCRRHWVRARVLDGGARVRAEPGIVLGRVNRLLARHGRKLGPDPASTDIACVGGVIANNSGGMRCGVQQDSYQTLRAMTLVLANGAVLDTDAPDAEARFARAAPELAAGLLEIRDELRADAELAARVRRKFAIKNTTGYRLVAFLDAHEPLEIFRRLVVGSEGTLAFVAEAEFETVPLRPHTTISLVHFPSIDAAVAAVEPLVAAGATATELMVAPTLVAAAWNMPGTPQAWRELPFDSAALLVEFRADEPDALAGPEAEAERILAGHQTPSPATFSRDPRHIEMLWRVREGMQGLLAAMREPGVQLIIEDVCFPPDRLAEGAQELQALLGKHGFLPGVAGHASAGNLHFLLTPNFTVPADLERYDAFMQDLVGLIVDRFDGSLKAEHGTGLNMAPFVEREWGPAATAMMWRIKELADPDGILNPGVVLNRDPRVHLRDLKQTPEVDPSITKCIECGFCEPVCPSRNVTTTPRQRIALQREIARQPTGSPVRAALEAQYGYAAVETCATDGSCMHACPVGIDTGAFVKGLRAAAHGERAESLGLQAARRFATAEVAARAGLRAGGRVARLARPTLPPAASGLPATAREGAAAVYLPACINRIFGNPPSATGRPSVPEALARLSARAGLPVWIPPDVAGHCCGTPWASKGYGRGEAEMAARTRAALERWSDGGRLPVVIDATSCAHGLRSGETGGVEVLDSIEWVHDHLLERLPAGARRLRSVVVHHTCAARHLNLRDKLTAIAGRIADEVIAPVNGGCCGMAGDRGWLHPELPASALRDVATELAGQRFDASISSNRTCEAALQGATGREYTSFLLELETCTRA